MEHSWRVRAPRGNICPVCSNPHLPFCPPLPPPYFRPPPPPPLHHPDNYFHSHLPPLPRPPPPYDPYIDHQSFSVSNYATQPPLLTPRPWNNESSFNNSFNDYSNQSLDYDYGHRIGVKRMRVDSSLISAPGPLTNENFSSGEDRRRLKLIRDHGAVNYNQEGNDLNKINYDARFGYGQVENIQNVESRQLPYHLSDHIIEDRSQFPVESRLSRPYSVQHYSLESEKVYNGLSSPNATGGKMQRSQEYVVQSHPTKSPPPPLLLAQSSGSSVSRGVSSNHILAKPESSLQSPYVVVSNGITSAAQDLLSKPNANSRGHYTEEFQAFQTAPTKMYMQWGEEVAHHHHFLGETKVVDASHILKRPNRATRPDHFVIILRGLPGSGKSYLAKILRDLEVENGGSAPRIHSIDEYFMIEVEKVEESEGSKSNPSVRGKKPVMKTVMEYCYEPEMEEAYRSSMLKAFKKTLDEGVFSFVIVDDRNLRVADFAQFWATAKKSGYEVYLLEAAYKDPAGCAARNVHGFTQQDIQKMANQWENAPSMYMKLDVKSLLHGDDLEESGIEEVDMDTEDGDHNVGLSDSEDTNPERIINLSEGIVDNEQKLDAQQCQPEVVKELGKSKWSNDLEEEDVRKTNATSENFSLLSGLAKSYKQGKSVCWADEVGRIGFSIGSGKAANVSLVIGPGSGYNTKSNPLPEEEKRSIKPGGLNKPNVFQEQLRAEREAFRAVFDKRRQRIGGLDLDDE